jgi:large subunit ribosomal protein L28
MREPKTMSRICQVCGKKPSFGNNRSHSMRATKRRWNVNVQRVHVVLNGKPTRAYVCAKCLKAHKIEKVA